MFFFKILFCFRPPSSKDPLYCWLGPYNRYTAPIPQSSDKSISHTNSFSTNCDNIVSDISQTSALFKQLPITAETDNKQLPSVTTGQKLPSVTIGPQLQSGKTPQGYKAQSGKNIYDLEKLVQKHPSAIEKPVISELDLELADQVYCLVELQAKLQSTKSSISVAKLHYHIYSIIKNTHIFESNR